MAAKRLLLTTADLLPLAFQSCSSPSTVLPTQLVHRSFASTTSQLFYPLQDVIVPSAGESITEGTVSAILKQAGQAVAQDEVVLQVDTDKVTIDVKAPFAGVLQAVKVAEGESIKMGQVVAAVDTDATASAAAPTASSQAPSQADSPRSHSRIPSIRFPIRRTPEGLAISTLPPEEQKRYLQQHTESVPQAESAAQTTTSTPTPQQTVSQSTTIKVSEVVHHIPRNTMTDREMEMIMLGGAEP